MSVDFSLFALAFVFLLCLLKANAQSIITGNASYIGGIPLRTPDSCPAGTVAGQITFEQNCCGAGQTFVKIEGSVCCETSSDCFSEVIAAPKCANSSWQLCGTNEGGFCCEEDWVCYTQTASGTNGGGVGCSTPGATLNGDQNQVATVYAANAGPDASTTAAPSSIIIMSGFTVPSSTSGTVSTSLDSSVTKSPSNSQLGSATSPPTDTGSMSSNLQLGSTTIQANGTGSISPSTSTSSSRGSSEVSSSKSTAAKKSSSIGGGPIAGIVVGAIMLLAAAFAGGVWFSRRKQEPDSSNSSILGKSKVSDVVEDRGSTPSIRRELGAHVPGKGHSMVYEVGNGNTPAAELSANERVAEMEAGFKR